jgi:hypothetical protein
MIPSTIMSRSQRATLRLAPWLAIVSGILGIFSFACLVAYIMTPALQMQDSGVVAPQGKLLLTVQFLTSMVQALLMTPVAIWLDRIRGARRRGVGRSRTILGVVAFGGVGLLRLVALVDAAVSDILFMIPIGLVGVWLAAVNWDNPSALPGWMRMLGGVAGICLLGVGLNFFFNGGLVVFSKSPMAYGDDVNFHIGLGLSGFPGFTLFPIWCILLGLRFWRVPNEALHSKEEQTVPMKKPAQHLIAKVPRRQVSRAE